mmetsp:Transcript_7019/g.17006  ORF Transcript_7019/g.17006 Transcript_7019/m.17006 type:complete len:82 (-) Transcript_7019:26-271(-)
MASLSKTLNIRLPSAASRTRRSLVPRCARIVERMPKEAGVESNSGNEVLAESQKEPDEAGAEVKDGNEAEAGGVVDNFCLE